MSEGIKDKLEDAAGIDDAAKLGDHGRRHAELLADDRLAAVAAVVRIAQLAVLGQLKLEKLVAKLALVAHAAAPVNNCSGHCITVVSVAQTNSAGKSRCPRRRQSFVSLTTLHFMLSLSIKHTQGTQDWSCFHRDVSTFVCLCSLVAQVFCCVPIVFFCLRVRFFNNEVFLLSVYCPF